MKKKTPTRERGAGTSRHPRTDEEKLCKRRRVGGQGPGRAGGEPEPEPEPEPEQPEAAIKTLDAWLVCCVRCVFC